MRALPPRLLLLATGGVVIRAPEAAEGPRWRIHTNATYEIVRHPPRARLVFAHGPTLVTASPARPGSRCGSSTTRMTSVPDLSAQRRRGLDRLRASDPVLVPALALIRSTLPPVRAVLLSLLALAGCDRVFGLEGRDIDAAVVPDGPPPLCIGSAPARVCLIEAISEPELQLSMNVDTDSCPGNVPARTEPSAAPLCVLAAHHITVTSAVRVTGSLAFVLFTDGDIDILPGAGLDAGSHRSAIGGPARNPETCATTTNGHPGLSSGGAGGGGAGGSFGGMGGRGGNGAMVVNGGAATGGPPTLVAFAGGCRGGGGGDPVSGTTGGGPGGPGGGAIALLAGGTIDVTGVIGAAGAGGTRGAAHAGGGGGGSGGLIILDAAHVSVTGAICANGGGGGGGGGSTSIGAGGEDGCVGGTLTASSGGPSSSANPGSSGGDGSALTTPPDGESVTADTSFGGGGGGGAGGVIRIHASVSMDLGVQISPTPM